MIRKMQDQDLAEACRMEEELFPSSPWDSKEFQYELHENPFATLYVLEEDHHVIGYADLWIMYEQAEVANIAVSANVQKQGLGSQLMEYMVREAVMHDCENLSLEVRISNAPAIALYEKYGFIIANRRKHYYEDGEDAWLMVKPLGGLKEAYDENTGN